MQSSNIMPLGFQQHPKQPKEPWFYYVLLKDFTGVYTKPGLSHSFNGRTEGNLLLVCQHPRTRSPNERGPIFSRSAVSSALASEIPPMPTTYARHDTWDCHICRSVGVVWGVNVGIYSYIPYMESVWVCNFSADKFEVLAAAEKQQVQPCLEDHSHKQIPFYSPFVWMVMFCLYPPLYPSPLVTCFGWHLGTSPEFEPPEASAQLDHRRPLLGSERTPRSGSGSGDDLQQAVCRPSRWFLGTCCHQEAPVVGCATCRIRWACGANGLQI